MFIPASHPLFYLAKSLGVEGFSGEIFGGAIAALTFLSRLKGSKAGTQSGHRRCPSGILESTQFASTGSSSYHALLINMHANLTPSLYALVSYTLGHSIDTGSSDTLPVLDSGPSNKGSSSFDVRQVLSASFGYRTPARFGHALGGWTLSSTSFARTGFPFDITTVDRSIALASITPIAPVSFPANPFGFTTARCRVAVP